MPTGDYASVVAKLRPGALDPRRYRSRGRTRAGPTRGHRQLYRRPTPWIGDFRAGTALCRPTERERKQVVVGPKEALSTLSLTVRDAELVGRQARGRDGRERNGQDTLGLAAGRGKRPIPGERIGGSSFPRTSNGRGARASGGLLSGRPCFGRRLDYGSRDAHGCDEKRFLTKLRIWNGSVHFRQSPRGGAFLPLMFPQGRVGAVPFYQGGMIAPFNQ